MSKVIDQEKLAMEIRARKGAEELAGQQANALRFLLSIPKIADSSPDFGAMMVRFLDSACELGGWVGARLNLHEKWRVRDIHPSLQTTRWSEKPNFKVNFEFSIREGDEVAGEFSFFADAQKKTLDALLLNVVESGAVELVGLYAQKEARSQVEHSFETLKKTQQQLIQSEKLASLGTIAAGVAHEINNPVSFVLSNIETLQLYLGQIKKSIDELKVLYRLTKENAPREKILNAVAEIESKLDAGELSYVLKDSEDLVKESLEGALRVREIVKSLHFFSRADETEREVTDVNECILAALRVTSNELKYKCTIQKELSPLKPIRCSPGHLLQVFVNLLINSAHAIAGAGTVTVRSKMEGESLCLEFSDTGSGISPQNLKNLFVPFFTTKPAGKGTGLGLSVSDGIIRDLGGSFQVESEVGKGTTFTIRIPSDAGQNLENPS